MISATEQGQPCGIASPTFATLGDAIDHYDISTPEHCDECPDWMSDIVVFKMIPPDGLKAVEVGRLCIPANTPADVVTALGVALTGAFLKGLRLPAGT